MLGSNASTISQNTRSSGSHTRGADAKQESKTGYTVIL